LYVLFSRLTAINGDKRVGINIMRKIPAALNAQFNALLGVYREEEGQLLNLAGSRHCFIMIFCD
jgi:hypothetical protein